jgi:hypothetical protein
MPLVQTVDRDSHLFQLYPDLGRQESESLRILRMAQLGSIIDVEGGGESFYNSRLQHYTFLQERTRLQ